jgi:hypothetical protein
MRVESSGRRFHYEKKRKRQKDKVSFSEGCGGLLLCFVRVAHGDSDLYLIWVTGLCPPFHPPKHHARDGSALSFALRPVSLTVFNVIRLGPGVFWPNVLRSLGILWELG